MKTLTTKVIQIKPGHILIGVDSMSSYGTQFYVQNSDFITSYGKEEIKEIYGIDPRDLRTQFEKLTKS